jgi:hypothetical protein
MPWEDYVQEQMMNQQKQMMNQQNAGANQTPCGGVAFNPAMKSAQALINSVFVSNPGVALITEVFDKWE